MSLKQQILSMLPTVLQRRIRRWWHGRTVAAFTWADWEFGAVVRRLIEPGDVVVDVGANIGYISKLLGEAVGETGRAYACEPIPETYEVLAHIIQERGDRNIHPCRVALSDHDGDVLMRVPEYAQGGANYYESSVIEGTGEGARSVRAMRLDDVLEPDDLTRLRFIKIDVEGHEHAVLKGATVALAQGPALLVEINGDPADEGSNAAEVFDLLRQSGYRAWCHKDRGLERYSVGKRHVDYLFLLPRHEEKLSLGGAGS